MGGIQTPTDLIYEDKGSKLHQSSGDPMMRPMMRLNYDPNMKPHDEINYNEGGERQLMG